MKKIENKEVWFVTGSQELYGPVTLEQVENNSTSMINLLNKSAGLLVPIIKKPIVKNSDEIFKICIAANSDEKCIGIVVWMHTFSPAKMWIRGLNNLMKPLCHLHTQFNADLPWENIDMDFMNLNQSAHGDREMGYMMTRMRKNRKIIVGHWQSKSVHQKLDIWSRVALGWNEMQSLKVARIGDNMREVAVTEGDKVEAQIRFGFAVNGYDTSDVLRYLPLSSSTEVKSLIKEYAEIYSLAEGLLHGGDKRESLIEAARIEIALKTFLVEGGFQAFTDTFENLGKFRQLPGLAVQRLMAEGYGFGAEGDWKTAALLRTMKVMAQGLNGGTSFMEDYTYHFTPERSLVLGAHMLEICPSIAKDKPRCEVHPLGIGGKDDPVRLVFNGKEGEAMNVSLVDLGNRFRLIVNDVVAVAPEKELSKLGVARVLWDAKPNLEVAATAWILAGGAHHTVYTQALSSEYLEDLAEIAGVEVLFIDNETNIRDFKNQLRTNEIYFHYLYR